MPYGSIDISTKGVQLTRWKTPPVKLKARLKSLNVSGSSYSVEVEHPQVLVSRKYEIVVFSLLSAVESLLQFLMSFIVSSHSTQKRKRYGFFGFIQ